MKRIAVMFIILSLLLFFACKHENIEELEADHMATVEFVEEGSFFDDFTIKDNQVELWCNICVNNKTKNQQIIRIQGDFFEDWKSGLLKERIIDAQAPLSGETQFVIPPGESRIHLVFCGTYGEGDIQKQNRLLPQIIISQIT
jgi:hypothetical protein